MGSGFAFYRGALLASQLPSGLKYEGGRYFEDGRDWIGAGGLFLSAEEFA